MKKLVSVLMIGVVVTLPAQQLSPKQKQQIQALIETQDLVEQTDAAMAQNAQMQAQLHVLTGNPLVRQPPPSPGAGGSNGGPGTDPFPPHPNFWGLALAILVDAFVVGTIVVIIYSQYNPTFLMNCFAALGHLWDKVFGNPPPDEPDPENTGGVTNLIKRTQFVPLTYVQILSDTNSVAARPCVMSNWMDVKAGVLFTNVLQTTVQAKETVNGQWTNFYTLTIWDSSKASLCLYRDANWNRIGTSYVFRTWNGQAWHQPPASIITDMQKQKKFYRLAAIPK